MLLYIMCCKGGYFCVYVKHTRHNGHAIITPLGLAELYAVVVQSSYLSTTLCPGLTSWSLWVSSRKGEWFSYGKTCKTIDVNRFFISRCLSFPLICLLYHVPLYPLWNRVRYSMWLVCVVKPRPIVKCPTLDQIVIDRRRPCLHMWNNMEILACDADCSQILE